MTSSSNQADNDERWRRIKALYAEAMKAPAAERLEWLRGAVPDDDALFHAVAGLFTGPADTDGAMSDIIARAASDLMDDGGPRTLGHYEIIGRLGEGGMGDVYLARRADGEFSQQVAIKVLGYRRPSRELVRRFQAERQILANLDHPNVARLIDGGETEDGLPYLVMEYVQGTPITHYCDEKGLSTGERLRLFTKVCAAVQHAHRNLVIHRDIKPSNILVTADGEPKLLDFGIAKLLEPAATDKTVVETVVSARLMTPRHASPEQVRGDKVTIATDIYSLGVLLYELLSGHFPYDVDGRSADNERAICETEPPAPSSRVTRTPTSARGRTVRLAAERGTGAHELARQLGGDLDNIVLAAMHKDPERRYATVRSLSDDIENYLRHRPVQARADSAMYRLGKFVRRNRVAVTATAVAIVAVVAATSVSMVRISAERDLAETERMKAEAVADFMQRIFEVSDPSEARGEQISARELLEAGADRIEYELAEQPAVQALMMRVLGEVYYSLGDWSRAEPLLEAAHDRLLELHGEHSTDVATAKLALGVLLQDNGRLDAADALFRDGMRIRRELLGYEHFDVVEAISLRAFLAETAGDLDRAEGLHREALTLARNLTRGDHEFVAESMTKLAGLYRFLDRTGEAEPLLRDALAMQDRLYAGDHPESASTKRQLAGLLRDTRRFEESERLYKEVLAARERMLGPDHLEIAHTWNSYSQMLADKGDLDAAVEAHGNFIDILERVYDGPHASFGAAYNNFAVLLKDQGDYHRALENYRLSIAMQDEIELPPDHPNRSFPLGGIAGVYLAQSRFDEAEPVFRQVLSMRLEHFPEGHHLISEIRGALGETLTGGGRYEEAERLLLEAHAAFEREQGPDDPGTRLTIERLAELYDASDRPDEAARWRARLANDADAGEESAP